MNFVTKGFQTGPSIGPQDCQDLCELFIEDCNYYTFDDNADICYAFEDCPSQSTEFCPAEDCVSGKPSCEVA